MKKAFVDVKNNRITFADQRFYQRSENIWYPSVTTILDVYPKGPAFIQWLKDTGQQAKYIAERAAESGSRVHDACERLMSGEELFWDDKVYSTEEWQGILKFHNFYTRFVNNVQAVEVSTFSDEYKYAGTIDLICTIGEEKFLIDLKFGNAVYTTYFLQLAAYRNSWNEQNPDHEIDKMGVLHLKASTRTEGKKGSIQGVGWQLIQPKDSYENLLEVFKKTLGIFNYENPDPRPKNLILPSVVKL